MAITALFDPQDARNPLPGVFYVLLWVGLVALSLAVRPVWRAISPVRTLHRLLGRLGLRYPEWAGYWPAAVGLLAFVWLELASPDPGSLGAIKIRGVQHGGISAVGAASQPRRPPGDRQPVRPPAVAAGARRHCRGAGGAVGIDRVRQHYVLSMHPSVLASIKVAGVVAGHIAAVIAAHDRASRLLPAGHQLTRQLAMMLVMVGYTFTGLYLLFGG